MTNANDAATGYGFANETNHYTTEGLTKREYFAAMAMQGIIAYGRHDENVATDSVELSDALITALNTNP